MEAMAETQKAIGELAAAAKESMPRGGQRKYIKPKTYMSKTEAIKDDIFDVGKPNKVMLFMKSHKNFISYIFWVGATEPIFIATALEMECLQ